MKISRLRTNHLTNPIGYKLDQISFSWVVSDTEGDFAQKTRVEVSERADFSELVLDSGIRSDISSLDYQLQLDTKPGTRYYWRVTAWDDAGMSAVSDAAFFETPSPFKAAKWIGTPFDQKCHPLMVKKLRIHGDVANCRLKITGLGVYEAYINGDKVSDEYLAPFYYDYNLWQQYQTYDVTGQLRQGDNVLGVMLGNGWYKGRFGFVDKMGELYGNSFKLYCELQITYADGHEEVIPSDESWLCAPSPVLESSIYDGEVYDSRKEIQNWSSPEGDHSGFQKAVYTEGPTELLTPRLSLPVRVQETITPVKLIHTDIGEDVIDFGQNMTGWVEFTCNEPEGTKICFQFGEILQQGRFYNENLRTAKEEYCYISNGKKARVRPFFTFYGFRYMKVTGISRICLEDFTGCVVYSDMEQIGKIETSNPKINQLFHNALWGQKGNFLDTPTDCPQRDERMGWTGDAQVFSATASMNMYTPAFYHKFLYDMKLEQDTLQGSVPHVVPDILGQINGILHAKDKSSDNVSVNTAHGSCAWGDAATIIPWTLYQSYGDKTLLEKHYGNMKDWTDYIRMVDVKECGGKYLWTNGFHYADWLALDNYHVGSSFGATDPYYVASVYYYYSASLTAKAAKVLEKVEDAAYYEDLAEHIKAAIQHEYFTGSGRIAVDTQTAMALALHFHLVPEEHREKLVDRLMKKLEEENMHLTTGFVGTPFLCPVLTENGHPDAAYTLLLNEDFPSWLYEVNMGATTIWERWNSVLPDGRISDTGMNSLNHYAYGSIVEWMYRYMCGLRAKDAQPGFKAFTISPYVDARFDHVSMQYDSSMGKICSGWKKTDSGYDFSIEVPFDTEAEFVLNMNAREVLVNGEKAPDLLNDKRIKLRKGMYLIHAVLG